MSEAEVLTHGSPAWREAQDAFAAEAYELSTQGLTIREVAERAGCSVETAYRRVKLGAELSPRPNRDITAEVQIRSLMRQKRVVLGILANPAYKVDHGRVVMDPLTQQPLRDQEMVLKASAELRRIEEAIMRLAGTRAPVVHEIKEITEEALDAEFQKLITVLPAAELSPPGG